MTLIDVLNGRRAQRIPVIATGAGLARELANVTWEDFRTKGSILAEVQLSFQRQTETDWVVVYCDALAIPELLGCAIRFSRISGPLIDQQLSLAGFKRPSHVDYYAVPSTAAMLEAAQICAANAPYSPIALLFEAPFTTALRIFEPEVALRIMFKAPQVLRSALDIITDILIGFAREGMRQGATIFHIPDPFSSMDFISPRHYREFSRPYQVRLFDAIRREGGHIILHMCGNTADIWQDMAGTGASALSLDQKMCLAEARAVLGDSVVLAGNVDPIRTLLMGDVLSAREAARTCISAAGPTNFVLMPGCGVPAGTPIENIRAMVEAGRQFVG